MSDFSKTFIQILSHMIITAVRDGEECDENTMENMAKMLDTAIGGRVETSTESEKKTSDKYLPGNVPEGKCPFILTRAPNTGKCCSLKVKDGSNYCSRHSKVDSEGGETTKVQKIVQKTAQSNVDVKKPEFKFAAAKKFTPMGSKSADAKATTEPVKQKIGIFTAKSNARVPSLFNKKKANFYQRSFIAQSENGEIQQLDFYFTDDPLTKNMVFIEEDGIRNVVGFIDEDVDEKDEPLPDDFMDKVNDQIQDNISQEQLDWCSKNKVSVPI